MVVKRSRKKRKFTYKENDTAQTQRRAAGGGNFDSFMSVPFNYSPKPGRNRIRIFPRTWEDDEGPRHWSYTAYVHYDVGPDNERYFCREKMNIGDGRCPICEERAEVLERTPDDPDDVAWDLRAGPTEICYVLNRKDPSRGPIPMLMPAKKVAKNVCDISIDETTGGVIKIDHPIRGRDIMFTVEGAGKRRDYGGIKLAPNPTPISEDVDEMDAWMDQVVEHPIPSLFIDYGYDYIAKKFGRSVSATKTKTKTRKQMAEGDSDELPPRRKKKVKKTTKRRRPAASDIDDADEELDAPPKRRKKTTKKTGVKRTKKSSLRGKVSKGTATAKAAAQKSKYDFDEDEIPF